MNTATAVASPELEVEKTPMAVAVQEAVSITQQDMDRAKAMVDSTLPPSYEQITPGVGAALYIFHNTHNRDIREGKVFDYRNGMKAGEWKKNHQGIAFYDNGNIADGQHRCAAIALSGVTITTLVTRGFEEDAIDTIDLGAARTAGDALGMKGIDDAKIKASIAKSAEEYLHKYEFDNIPKFRIQQVEKMVLDYDEMLSESLVISYAAYAECSEKIMTLNAMATGVYLLLRGGWGYDFVQGFFSRIATGEDYAESPAAALHEQFFKAAQPRTRDRFTPTQRLAHICKGATQWSDKKSVKKVVVGKKESLPSPEPILGVDLAAGIN